MRFGQIRALDVANGSGIRVSLFVTGCKFNCKGCFNIEYQDFNYGTVFKNQHLEEIIDYLSKDYIKGFSILGGEPFENTDDLLAVVYKIRQYLDDYNLNYQKKDKLNKDIWIYSGYLFENLIKDPLKLQLLQLCDVLVDGLFVEELLDLRLKFKGSSNQRIIDIQKSLSTNQVIELDL